MDGSELYISEEEEEPTPTPMEMAVNAVLHGGMTLRAAQKHYCVPYSTLQWRVRYKKDGKVKRGRKPVLSEKTEQTMLKAVLALKDSGLGLSRKEIMFIATEKDAASDKPAFSETGPTNSWFRRFKNRNKLSLRRPENKSISRYAAEEPEIYDDLMAKYWRHVDENDLSPSQIFNADETGFQLVTKNPRIITTRGDKKVHVKKTGERSETISVMVCGNACGSVVVPPFVIFKGQSLPSNLRAETYPAGSTLAYSETGYMNSSIFLEWFKIFINHIPRIRPVLLLLDGHKSHTTLPVAELARENDIILHCLPPHSTHLYQPLDVGVFGSMKSAFKAECAARMRIKKGRGLKKEDFGKIFKSAWNSSVTASNFEAGFNTAKLLKRDTGDEIENDQTGNASSSNTDFSLLNNSDELHGSKNFAASTPKRSHQVSKDDSDIVEIIKDMLKPSPNKGNASDVQVSKRIKSMNKFSYCITTDEYIAQLKAAKDEAQAKQDRKEEREKRKAAAVDEKNKKTAEKNKRMVRYRTRQQEAAADEDDVF